MLCFSSPLTVAPYGRFSNTVPISFEYENGEVLGTLPAGDYEPELLTTAIAALIPNAPLCAGVGRFVLAVKMPHVWFDLLAPVPR